MDLLASGSGRRVLFAALYLSEGAPIGFLWLALPTRLRLTGVPLEEITWLTAMLVLPWTLKFAWAPLVDVLRTRHWTLKHWVVSAQIVMGATLVPLLWLDLKIDFGWIAALLLCHAFAAATQDVSIDALCISVADPLERGRLNGWMQAGMLLGRAAMGGGALILAARVGDKAVVLMLIVLTTFSSVLLLQSRLPAAMRANHPRLLVRAREIWIEMLVMARQRNTWLGLGFAAIGGAAFKSLEVILGPFLIDHKYTELEVGWFSAGPMITCMIVGSLIGGWLADRVGRRRSVAASLLWIVASVASLAISDWTHAGTRGQHLLIFLASTAVGIGLFTAASYAMFMDITSPAIAATQFSAFMGATNACESWSTYSIGRLVAAEGYPIGMLAMCGASLLALPLLWAMKRA